MSPSDAELLTVDEAAVLLRVPRSSLYNAVKAGTIRGVVRVGRNIRIHVPTLLAFPAGEVRAPRSRRKA